MKATAVRLHVTSGGPSGAEQLAIDFCARGPGIALQPWESTGPVSRTDAPTFSCDPQPIGSVDLRVTDAAGMALAGSSLVVEAVRQALPFLEVQIRDASDSVLASGRVATRRSVALTRTQVLSVAGPLLVMAVSGGARPLPDISVAASARRSPLRGLPADVAGLAGFGGRLARAAVTRREWSVARFPHGTTIDPFCPASPPTAAQLRLQAAGGWRFWADPCAVDDGAREVLFVEEFRLRTGRGVVRLLDVDADGGVRAGPVCLSTSHHLSFPQVYRTADGWLATVETCARINPIYRFDQLGDPWKPSRLPALPPGLADPVLTFDAAGAVSGVVGTDAGTDPNSVFTVHELADGRWVRDDAATFVDVTRARSGGTLDVVRGLRAVQDCAGTYGRAVRLTGWPNPGPEDVVTMDTASMGRTLDGHHPAGWHTLSWTPDGHTVWCDAWRRKPTAFGAVWRLAERRHPRHCRG